MVYQDLTNMTSNDLNGILSFPNLDTPVFYPLFMTVIFLILTYSTYSSEKQRTGRGNFLSSLAVSGLVTIVIATLLSAMSLISTTILITTIVISAIFIILYFIANKY